MANKYYYLCASLPYCRFGAPPPLSSEAMLVTCAAWLTPGDMAALRSALLPWHEIPDSGVAFLERWRTFEREARVSLAAARRARLEQGGRRVDELMRGILRADDPLAAERQFEKLRWDFLNEEESFFHFDLNWLIVTLLKIRILERLAGFDAARGAERFAKVSEVVYG